MVRVNDSSTQQKLVHIKRLRAEGDRNVAIRLGRIRPGVPKLNPATRNRHRALASEAASLLAFEERVISGSRCALLLTVYKSELRMPPVDNLGETVTKTKSDSVSTKSELLQGTLDMLILKTVALEAMHGWGISQRIQQTSAGVLSVNQGSLYPRSIVWNNKDGSNLNGVTPRIIVRPSTTSSPGRAGNSFRRSLKTGIGSHTPSIKSCRHPE